MPSAPPFALTPAIMAIAGDLERLIGRAEGVGLAGAPPMLRKRSRVRTIRGSVGIEGNTLSEEQVTALHVAISTATASRDLHEGVSGAVLQSRGQRRLTEYRFSGRRG